MATGIVRALRSAGVGELWVASRTVERAQELAQREGGKACRMQDISEQLVHADIVLVSSAAPHYIIGPAQIEAAVARRRGRALCLIDISVPRNVDPEVGSISGDIFLFDIDDLEEVARDGRREREAVAARWRPRLAEEARSVLRELQETGPNEMARRLMAHANTQREEVLHAAHAAGLDEKAVAELSRALERLQGRFLHGPLETLKQAAREGDGADASAWVSRLFRLESERSGAHGRDKVEEHGKAAKNKTPEDAAPATVPKSCKEKSPDAKPASARPANERPPLDLSGPSLAQTGP
jgi:glutamyl-tRNA reductase